MAQAQRAGERRDVIDLERMNKYVGYRSPNLTVKLEQVQASVKMLQLREDGGC